MRDMKDYVCLQGWGCQWIVPKKSGVQLAAQRHDTMALRKYAKPFKWFKFNRARRGTVK